jgi:hypothetical protein
MPSTSDPQPDTPSSTVPDPTPFRRVAAAFQSFAESEQVHLDNLLRRSDHGLTPLSDPLRLSLRKHRWLQREREESYSDWLAWLLQEMGSTESALKVFGLDNTTFGELVRGAPLEVIREKTIPVRDGEKKRLDLEIRFGEIGILIVEVKVRAIEEAGGSDNLPLYLEWLRKQRIGAKHGILLVSVPMESPDENWDVRTWDDLSLGLRGQAIALQKAAPNNLLLAALLLCFAGAVEQNVLGFTGQEAVTLAPQSALHLERFLKENGL